MHIRPVFKSPAAELARHVRWNFDEFRSRFQTITRRVQRRFETCDWDGLRTDAAERLSLYDIRVSRCVEDLRLGLNNQCHDKITWMRGKAIFRKMIADRPDSELAEIFFNALSRRILETVGVDPAVEFTADSPSSASAPAHATVYRSYPWSSTPLVIMQSVMAEYEFRTSFEDLSRDARRVVFMMEDRLCRLPQNGDSHRLDMLAAPVFHGERAYLVGRLVQGACIIPLVLVLGNGAQGIYVDALLMDEENVSILFSYTRSYFHIATPRPGCVVRFLKSLLPQKSIADLYIFIGCQKHGKTLIYQDLIGHTTACGLPFEPSVGQPGLTMSVINFPDDEVVLKVIKDHFEFPKKTTRRKIRAQYDFVSRHERVGRLVDAHAFEYLEFDCCWFPENLLRHLQAVAERNIHVEDNRVVIKHAYVERRVVPLDVYLNEADPDCARSVVVDYGRAIKDLAAGNIFPGDMVIKNFGVTRHNRVVFYDYDELCPLTECRFRLVSELPPSDVHRTTEPHRLDARDIFPEEFRLHLGLSQDLMKIFMNFHADLFEVDFWRNIQNRIRSGKLVNIPPYAPSCILRGRNKVPPALSTSRKPSG